MPLLEKLASLKLPIVLGEGPRDAKLVILGEALGEEEVRKGRPFVGKAGWMLDDILRAAKVPREQCRVMNVIPTRPPGNKIERLKEYGIALEEFQDWCRGELRSLTDATCVLALGNIPLATLCNHSDITSWRGSILSWEGKKVIPSFHPSYVMRLPDKTAKREREGEGATKYTYGSARLTCVLDSKRAWEESKSGSSIVHPARNLIVQPSFGQVQEYLLDARQAELVAFDVETKGKWVDCISFSFNPSRGISIPRGAEYWKGQEERVDELIKRTLWSHEGLVAQNGAFDITLLLGNALPIHKLYLDTMVSHHFLYPELPHDLAYLTSVYTKEPYYKWMLKASKQDEQMRWRYNALDAACTLEIAQHLAREMEEFKVADIFTSTVMPLFHTVLKMGLRGVRVDEQRKARLQRALAWLIQRKVEKMREALGVELNHRSPKQLHKYLYEDLKLPVQRDRKTKKVTADEEAIRKLSKIKGKEKLTRILDVRDLEKKKSTYADMDVSFDGRLRTSYSVTGTPTGRLNSKETLFGEGWNSQNAPEWFRRIVVPGSGNILLEADLKFAEALLIAWFAQDKATIEAVRNGADIYKWHGARMFGVPVEQIDKDTRDMIKPVILGCGYGLGPRHMAEMLAYKEQTLPDGRVVDIPTGITYARAVELRALFFKSCPAIGEYQKRVQEQLRETRTLVTPFGRRRQFLGRMNEELFRKGYAFLPQSSCVDYLNRGMIRVDARLPDLAKLLLQVHDAMVVECGKVVEEQVTQIMVEELAKPVVIHGEALVIPVEIKRSEKSWGEMKIVGVFNSQSGWS